MIDFEVRESTAIITIQRPEARNAVNAVVANGIEAAIDRVENNPDIWVGVLTGEGPVFCAGADLAAIAAGDSEGLSTSRGGFGGLVQRPRVKPLVAAVDGPALAGGLELALACDLIVASRHAVFGLPEVKRSLVAAGGGMWRLPRAVGAKVASEMLMTGDPITAERAYHLGLVNRLTEPGGALAEALVLARRIAGNAPVAVRQSRRVAEMAHGASDEDLWYESGRAAATVARSDDFIEGPRAFVEHRHPLWSGH